MGTEPWVQQALDDFVKKDLMLSLDGRYLSLALPANPNFELALGPQAVTQQQPRPPVEGFVPAIQLVTPARRGAVDGEVSA
jgi:hypothetical protein